MTWTFWSVSGSRLTIPSRSLIRQGNDLDPGEGEVLRGGEGMKSRSLIRQGNDLDYERVEVFEDFDAESRSLIRQGNDLDSNGMVRMQTG